MIRPSISPRWAYSLVVRVLSTTLRPLRVVSGVFRRSLVPRHSLVSCAFSPPFPIPQTPLQPVELRADARFPDALFCVLSHARRIARCNGCIFVVAAAQLPEQEQPLHSIRSFRSSDLRASSSSSGLSGIDGSKISDANSRETSDLTLALCVANILFGPPIKLLPSVNIVLRKP